MNNSDKDNNHKIISLGQIDIDPSKFNAEPDLDALPLLATQNLVLFPGVTIPISLVRISSQFTAQYALDSKNPIGIVCQRNPEDDAPTIESLYDYGTIADVIKIFDLPDGGHTAIIRARDKFHILDSAENNTAGGNALAAKVEIVKDVKPRRNDKDFVAVVQAIKNLTLRLTLSVLST